MVRILVWRPWLASIGLKASFVVCTLEEAKRMLEMRDVIIFPDPYNPKGFPGSLQ